MHSSGSGSGSGSAWEIARIIETVVSLYYQTIIAYKSTDVWSVYIWLTSNFVMYEYKEITKERVWFCESQLSLHCILNFYVESILYCTKKLSLIALPDELS